MNGIRLLAFTGSRRGFGNAFVRWEPWLFNRYDEVGMDGNDGNGDYTLDLHHDLLRAGSFDLDEHTFAAFEYTAGDSDFLCFGEVDLGRAEETEGLIVGSGHGYELPHLFLWNRDLFPKPLIHHILEQWNARGLFEFLNL